MPIYDSAITREAMSVFAKNHKCGRCGGQLAVAWGGCIDYDGYILRCAKDIEHDVITRYRKPSIEEVEANRLFKGELRSMDTNELQALPPTAMTERVNKAKFPKDMTIEDRHLVAQVATEYGLDPLFGELMVYQGRPYVTIDARRRKAQETGQLDGINTRPATPEEKEARGVPPEDYLFLAQVWVKDAKHPFEGWGRVRQSETRGNEYLPIVKDPPAQAEKRAESQALRRGFHLPLPSFEDIGNENGAPSSVKVAVECDASSNEAEVDAATRELWESQDSGHVPHSVRELLEWVASHGKSYNRTWLVETMHIREYDILNKPQDCYWEVKETMGW